MYLIKKTREIRYTLFSSLYPSIFSLPPWVPSLFCFSFIPLFSLHLALSLSHTHTHTLTHTHFPSFPPFETHVNVLNLLSLSYLSTNGNGAGRRNSFFLCYLVNSFCFLQCRIVLLCTSVCQKHFML